MRLPGKFGDASVEFLVDSGGTHNFCSIRTLLRAGLEVTQKLSREVILGDGQAEPSCSVVLKCTFKSVQNMHLYPDIHK
jgi:hypothetical protein